MFYIINNIFTYISDTYNKLIYDYMRAPKKILNHPADLLY